jgi:hypothetical protein
MELTIKRVGSKIINRLMKKSGKRIFSPVLRRIPLKKMSFFRGHGLPFDTILGFQQPFKKIIVGKNHV